MACLLFGRIVGVDVSCSMYTCSCEGVGGVVVGCIACNFGLGMS